MAKTTPEQELNALHTLVSKVLSEGLRPPDEIVMLDGVEIKIPQTPPPALIAQAIKFLKDNNITSIPENDKNLDELANILKTKRKHSSLTLVDPKTAAGEADG